MSALTVTVETVAQMWPEMQDLLREHYNEIAQHKDAIPLAPDRERYKSMERAGSLLSLACRKDGAMVGYSVFFMIPHIHYSQTLVAINDVLFVTKPMRKSRAGLMLIRESEAQAKKRGAVKISWHVKPELDWAAVLLHRGYGELEKIYGKLL